VAYIKGTNGCAGSKFTVRHGEKGLFLGVDRKEIFGGFGQYGGCVVDMEREWDVLVYTELLGNGMCNRYVEDNMDQERFGNEGGRAL